MPTNVAKQSEFPHISEVKPRGEQDRELMRELHDVLERYDALERFGITLLHHHFEMAADEVLLEETNTENRIQTIRPAKVAEVLQFPTTETSWSLKDGEPQMSCVCIKYANNDHQHQSRGYAGSKTVALSKQSG